MQQVPIISIKMVPAGVELVLNALNQLPREQVDGLYSEIFAQYRYQVQELNEAAQAANDQEATSPSLEDAPTLGDSSDPVSSTANLGE